MAKAPMEATAQDLAQNQAIAALQTSVKTLQTTVSSLQTTATANQQQIAAIITSLNQLAALFGQL